MADAAAELGNSGYVVHTLALACYCFASSDSALEAIERALLAGGDTDTIAAIAGAWAGAELGESALPSALLARIQDGPFGPSHLRAFGRALANGGEAPRWSVWAAFARNSMLYPVVLCHGFRRLIPRW